MRKKMRYWSIEGFGFIAMAMPVPESGDPLDFGCPSCMGTALTPRYELQQLGFDHYKAILFIQCNNEQCKKWYTVELELSYEGTEVKS